MAHVIYTVMSLLTHMAVVDLMYRMEYQLEAVLEHWVAHSQEGSMVQMVMRTVMGLQAGKLVEMAGHIEMWEDMLVLVDVMQQSGAVQDYLSSLEQNKS